MLGVTAEETQSLRVVGRHPVSLHEPIGGDGERALEDFLDDRADAEPRRARRSAPAPASASARCCGR